MGFDIIKWPGFPLLTSILLTPRAQQFFLMLGIVPAVKNNERIKFRENLVLCSLKKENQVLILQLQDLREDQVKEPYIRVNTRKLNRELCTGSSTLYTKL